MIKKEVLATRVTKQMRNDIAQYIGQTGKYLNEADFIRQIIREKIYGILFEDEIRAIIRDELQKCSEKETEE